MAGDFINIIAGRVRQVIAIAASAGAADAAKVVKTNAQGYLDHSLLPPEIGEDTTAVEAGETLASGDLVNFYDDAGTRKIRKADATAQGKETDGFVNAGATAGQTAIAFFEGRITGLAALTIGARYYTSASTPGAVTATPPSGSGNVVQYIGRAVSATEIAFEPSEGVILA